MTNLLIGSSNVNRHYKNVDFPSGRKYKVVKCTQIEGFATYMETLPSSTEAVLISVVENFVVDAVGADVTEPNNSIDSCIKTFLSIIQKSAAKLPATKFGIVMPLTRPAIPWYQERIDSISSFMDEGIKAMISDRTFNNVTNIDCIPALSQVFEDDKVHLTKASAKAFLETITNLAEDFFTAATVDLTSEPGEISDEPSHIKALEDRLARLEDAMRYHSDKNVGNDLMFARLREETDANTNKAKEDRLVMNGLKSSTPIPDEPRLRIDALKALAAKIFDQLIPGFDGKIVYLSPGKQQGQPIPMVEIKMDKPEQAIALRKAYAEKKKNKSLSSQLETLFVSNSVSLATRIRIDILKAIARRITNKDDLAYVAGFTSRPMLHIRRAGPPSASG